MPTRRTVRRALFGRGVAVAFAVITGPYLVRFVRFRPLQVPAYLLVVAYDVVEVAVPVLAPYYPVAFPVFLYLLAIVGAGAARWFRSDDGEEGAPHQVIGGVCLVVGTISVLFAASVGGPLVVPADNPTPLAITGATGVLLLLAGWWLLGRPMGKLASTR